MLDWARVLGAGCTAALLHCSPFFCGRLHGFIRVRKLRAPGPGIIEVGGMAERVSPSPSQRLMCGRLRCQAKKGPGNARRSWSYPVEGLVMTSAVNECLRPRLSPKDPSLYGAVQYLELVLDGWMA